MAKQEDIFAKCPFYSCEEGLNLYCKVRTQNLNSLQIRFDTKEGRRDFERKLCRRVWKDCPFAQALTRMWEDEP